MELFATNRGDADPVAVGGHRVMQQVRDHAVFLLDRRGRAASWNEGVRHIFGWDEHDWLGQPLHVIFTPEDVAANAPALELQQASDSGRADDTRWMLRKNGERFFAVGAVTRIVDDRGRLAGFLKVLRDCTESQRADEERERLLAAERLARAEAERQAAALATALDAMPDAVYIGTADGITRCNAPALTMLGAASVQDLQQRRDELGRKFRVRYERDGPLVEPDDLPFARALRGETAVLETWATKADTGEDVLIRGTAAPIVVDGEVVGALAVNSDLTQRLQFEQDRHKLKQVETALHERDQEFQALVDGVREYAIFTVDVEGKISSWHEGAARMKGYSAEEAIGMPFAQLFMQADRDTGLPQQEMAAAARTGEYQGEGLRLRKNGETFDAGFVLTALRDPLGKLLGYLKLTQDISARKRQEREREKMLLSAQAARTEAERANLFKDD
ncbi:MAG TPA: PAS domain S-box protein, partial [Rhizobacter sp.]|nr:PAS domain S-box protein [Rhizobacter sp.]